jgi:hypothetical protein
MHGGSPGGAAQPGIWLDWHAHARQPGRRVYPLGGPRAAAAASAAAARWHVGGQASADKQLATGRGSACMYVCAARPVSPSCSGRIRLRACAHGRWHCR